MCLPHGERPFSCFTLKISYALPNVHSPPKCSVRGPNQMPSVSVVTVILFESYVISENLIGKMAACGALEYTELYWRRARPKASL